MARILFADDNLQMCKNAGRACSLLGHDCKAFDAAADAWEHLQREDTPYDLIISDNDMPMMQGSEFLTRVRGHPVHGRTSFTLLTGSDDNSLVELCEKHGARFRDKLGMDWLEVIGEGLAA